MEPDKNKSITNSNENDISFMCIYDIKDYNETCIINNKFKDIINEDIKQKIKILNGNKKESIVFKKNLIKLELMLLIL